MATYSYAASSGAVVRIAGVSSTTDSAVDATGSRLATKTSTALFGWTLPDLHGDVAGALSSSGSTITDAFRYDAYGETIDKATSSLPTPWRYQGRLLENEAGDADLYDFGFRRYAADLGAFNSIDDQPGSAQNPISLNRFLYANANPETLTDPDGHCPICIAIPIITAPEWGPVAVGAVFGVAAVGAAAVGWAAGSVIGPAIKSPSVPTERPRSCIHYACYLPHPLPRVRDVIPLPNPPPVTPRADRTNPRWNPPPRVPHDPHNYPLPPGNPCRSAWCKGLVTALVAALSGLSGFGLSGHQHAEGESRENLRDEVDRLHHRHRQPSVKPAPTPSRPQRRPPRASPPRVSPSSSIRQSRWGFYIS